MKSFNTTAQIFETNCLMNLSQHSEDCDERYQFTCKSNNQCVDEYRVCDGIIDCENGEDESADYCQGNT